MKNGILAPCRHLRIQTYTIWWHHCPLRTQNPLLAPLQPAQIRHFSPKQPWLYLSLLFMFCSWQLVIWSPLASKAQGNTMSCVPREKGRVWILATSIVSCLLSPRLLRTWSLSIARKLKGRMKVTDQLVIQFILKVISVQSSFRI